MVRTGTIAKAMGVTGRSVRMWCESGRLKATVYPGEKHYRVMVRDALEFAKTNALRFDVFQL